MKHEILSLYLYCKSLKIWFVFGIISLFLFFGFFSHVHAATGDITAVRIIGDATHNGWTAEIDISGLDTGGTYDMGFGANNNPSTAKVVFTATSPGYDTSGNSTTTTRTIYGTKFVRKPYPDSSAATSVANESSSSGTLTVKVALSDFIYSGDTSITATISSGFYTKTSVPNNAVTAISVTNSSTLAYPKTIGHFAIEQRRPVNGTQNIEVLAVQKFGKDAKPVALVSVTATGATSGHVESGSATAMTLSSRGDNIPVYSIPLNLSTSAGFTRGELVNINFTAYPWVGDSSAKLDSTVDAGATIEKLGLLKWTIMDKMISVVDLSTGNDSTCVASLVQATADASPCLTISGALTKIAAQNNTSYTLNRTDGGEVQLKAGTYKTGKYAAQAVTNGYFTITPHSSTNRAGVIFDGYVTSQSQYAFQRYYNVTFNRPGNGYIVFAANTNVLIMESVNFADAFTAWYSGDTNTNIEFLDNTTSNGIFSVGGNDGHSRLNRNNTYTNPSTANRLVGNASAVIGLKGTGGSSDIWNSLVDNETNIIIAYTKWLAMTDGYFVLTAKPLTNMAVINNLVERIGVAATPLSEISSADISNIVLWHNTYTGQRFNHENDFTTNKTLTNYTGSFNSFNARGDHRMDLRGSGNSALVGAWSVGYSVGWQGNHNEAIAYAGDSDFWGLYSNIDTGSDSGTTIVPSAPVGYVIDKSQGGTNVGSGDYHMTASSLALNKVNSGSAVLPYDLEGNARHNNGFGAAGAYEWDVIAPTVTAFSIPSTASSLTVTIDTFTATDAVGVTGYKVTESSTAPAFDSVGWTVSAPTDYTFSTAGSKTLYAWAKDGVGNVSTSISDTVTIDTAAPTITNVSSDKANGNYSTGEVIDIDVTFSEAVTSSGNVTVTLETGATDRTCAFSVSNASSGTCNYTVQSGDSTSDLTVSSISGTIVDGVSSAMVNFVPATNLAANKALVIDTDGPIRSSGLPSGEQAVGTTEVTLSITTDEAATCKYGTVADTAYASIASTFSTTGGTTHSKNISSLTDGTSYNYYVRCIDGTLNTNSADYIISFSVASPATSTITSGSVRTLNPFLNTPIEVCKVGDKFSSATGLPCPKIVITPNYPVSDNQPTCVITTTLKVGSRGTDVKCLQKSLNIALGILLDVDSSFGPKTKKAVILFQQRNKLVPDGIVGPKTRTKVNGR